MEGFCCVENPRIAGPKTEFNLCAHVVETALPRHRTLPHFAEVEPAVLVFCVVVDGNNDVSYATVFPHTNSQRIFVEVTASPETLHCVVFWNPPCSCARTCTAVAASLAFTGYEQLTASNGYVRDEHVLFFDVSCAHRQRSVDDIVFREPAPEQRDTWGEARHDGPSTVSTRVRMFTKR